MSNEAFTASIIIPTYNAADYIERCVASALSQESCGLEIVVVDDGSNDGTLEAMQSHRQRIVFCHQDNSGVAVARNKGVLLSGGEFLVFLDADDRIMPRMTAELGQTLARNPNAAVAYCGWVSTDSDGKLLSTSPLHSPSGSIFRHLIAYGGYVVPCAAMIRRESLLRSGLFDPFLPDFEDYDLWLRLALVGEFEFVPMHLAEYTQAVGSRSRNYSAHSAAVNALVARTRALLVAKGEPLYLLRDLRRNLRRHIAARYAGDAFLRYQAGHYSQAWRCVARAMVLQPEYARNRGLWSVGIRSIKLGRRKTKCAS